MSGKRRRSSAVDISRLFDAESLKTAGQFEIAVAKFESLLSEQQAKADYVEPLLSKPHLFEWVFSVLSESCPLLQSILDAFPIDANAFLSSLQCKLLHRLSVYFLFLSYPFEENMLHDLKTKRHSVELSFTAFQAISTTKPPRAKGRYIIEADDSEFFVSVKPKSQRLSKSSKWTDSEGIDRAYKLLAEQKMVLQFYLCLLRKPDLCDEIKNTYLLPYKTETMIQAPAPVSQELTPQDAEPSPNTVVPSAYPMVQPMKAALYFDNAADFGDWRIFISTRAQGHLREARRSEPINFKIYIKKIKELSKGHFSPDNQKRLNNSQADVAIYEAKMTRDKRLVYQVDCMADYDTACERQVLKIFGIYTHAQLDHRLWDSMSQHLRKKGKEYKRRCDYRHQENGWADNVFSPKFWPTSSPTPLERSGTQTSPPAEVLEQIHTFLVLEKFAPLSKALLNSIIADQDVQHIFQVSPEEREIIEHEQSCYVLGRSGTGKTTTMLFKMLGRERIWKKCGDDLPKPRQLFVTQSPALASKVQEYFCKLMESLATGDKSREELAALMRSKPAQQTRDLVTAEDDVDVSGNLPTRFSMLKDNHFPLFLTFNRLCSLLEEDLRQAEFDHPKPCGLSTMTYDSGTPQFTYKRFVKGYWPHLPQNLTKGLDPFLVFSEILGVIKGSENALSYPKQIMSQAAYEALGQSAFSSSPRRADIYPLFEAYARLKRERGDLDAADRTHAILRALDKQGIPGRKVEYLYIDEAQDNLLIDALLLRRLCNNPHGLFWAGDTAQTISAGSSFKFNELKASLFRVERSSHESNGWLASMLVEPKMFQLTVNYRSHGGIVNCAHSVVDLIMKFWPDSIDFLSPERGIVDGAKPVFFTGWDQNTVRYEQFLFGGDQASAIEFGANQCILVRDEAGRKQLQKQVGDIGLVMTLYESKGLEFNDVLLYNFFEDSAASVSQWRVVLNELGLSSPVTAAPDFDETRHAAICSELKCLYVAITRARTNLWIVDCSPRSEPMRLFWSARNQIEHCTPGMNVPRLAVKSTPEEWAQTGRSLFQHTRYLQAMHCFERAGLQRESDVANAYYLREQAQNTFSSPGQDSKARLVAFNTAAHAFLKCAKASQDQKPRLYYFQTAGKCFEGAGEVLEAAKAYFDGEDFTRAVQLYRQVNMFAKVTEIIHDHEPSIDEGVLAQVRLAARLFYFKEHQFDRAIALFSSQDEAFEFTETYDLDRARADLHEREGRLSDAARVHIEEGRVLEGIRLLLKDTDNKASVLHAKECVLHGLWQNLSYRVDPETAQANDTLKELLVLAEQLGPAQIDENDRNEIRMFRAIFKKDFRLLQRLGEGFESNNKPAALLSLEHVFEHALQYRVAEIQDSPIHAVMDTLKSFLCYARLLQSVACLKTPFNDTGLQRLFGLQPTADDLFLVNPGSFLHDELARYNNSGGQIQGDRVLKRGWELSPVLTDFLWNHLRSRIEDENRVCRRIKAFTPCVPFLVNGRCYRIECSRDHLEPAAFTPGFQDARVRIHLLQILIMQILRSIAIDSHRRDGETRYWLNQLYEALRPQFYSLGRFMKLTAGLFDEALPVVRDWAQQQLFPNGGRNESMSRFMIAVSLCFDIDGDSALGYIHRSPCLHSSLPDQYLKSLRGAYQDSILSALRFLKGVIDNCVAVNISALCDFVEFVCASMVILGKGDRLDNITLPLSWITNILTTAQLGTFERPRPWRWFLGVTQKLLEQLYKESTNYLMLEGGKVPPAYRHVFAVRICRCLCLLGYNIRNDELRGNILRIMQSLRSYAQNTLLRPYVEAKTWGHLARAIHRSATSFRMDEMIRLQHESRRPRFTQNVQDIRPCFFKTREDILPILLGESSAAKTLTLRPDAVPFIPQRLAVDTSYASDELAPDTDVASAKGDEDEIEEDVDETNDIHSADGEDLADVADAPNPPTLPTDDEIRAALRIQRVCRRHLSRLGNTTEGGLVHHFTSCLSQARATHWSDSRYRCLFLGPLPHLLLCLDFAIKCAQDCKTEAKLAWNTSSNVPLEKAGERLNEAVARVNFARKLWNALKPNSKIHSQCKPAILASRALEVEQLIRELRHEDVPEIRENLKLALKAIQLPKTATPMARPGKPQLCVDDGFLLYNGKLLDIA